MLVREVCRSNQVGSKALTLPLVYSTAAQAISAFEPSTSCACLVMEAKMNCDQPGGPLGVVAVDVGNTNMKLRWCITIPLRTGYIRHPRRSH